MDFFIFSLLSWSQWTTTTTLIILIITITILRVRPASWDASQISNFYQGLARYLPYKYFHAPRRSPGHTVGRQILREEKNAKSVRSLNRDLSDHHLDARLNEISGEHVHTSPLLSEMRPNLQVARTAKRFISIHTLSSTHIDWRRKKNNRTGVLTFTLVLPLPWCYQLSYPADTITDSPALWDSYQISKFYLGRLIFMLSHALRQCPGLTPVTKWYRVTKILSRTGARPRRTSYYRPCSTNEASWSKFITICSERATGKFRAFWQNSREENIIPIHKH